MQSVNKIDKNVESIRKLFPNCVSEGRNEEGKNIQVVDFDMLKQELSDYVVEGREERYQFNWPDKKRAVLAANTSISKTLRPVKEESINYHNTENLYIEGDNLEVLKLLQETYLSKVKMIYIDPPYNTGNDFIYEDDFSQNAKEYILNSGLIDENGHRLTPNLDSNGRFHTDWLNMIYPRLKVSRDLLTDDGVMMISIDDNEIANLKKVCDEIFGAVNFIAQIAVQLNPRGRNLDKFVAKTHEYVLIYAKNSSNYNTMFGLPKEGKMVDEYNKEDAGGRFRLIGLRNRNQSFNPQTRPNLYYPLYVNPNSKKVALIKDSEFTDEVYPDTPDGIQTCWTWAKEKFVKENYLITAEQTKGEWRIYRKDYLHGENGEVATTLVKSFWYENNINNDYGKKSIKKLFGSSIMDFPKSPELLKKLIRTGVKSNDIVLDFFSGSSTTAHALIELNLEQTTKNKFIMVQVNEDIDNSSNAAKAGYNSIAEIGKARIKKLFDEINSNNPEEAKEMDLGYRLLRVDSTNMKEVYYKPHEYEHTLFDDVLDNIKDDRTSEDLLFQIMLELGVLLSSRIEEEVIDDKSIFNVADGYLLACFDKDVSECTIEAIAKKKPYYFVMRDCSMVSDNVATNFNQIFEMYSPETIRKVI